MVWADSITSKRHSGVTRLRTDSRVRLDRLGRLLQECKRRNVFWGIRGATAFFPTKLTDSSYIPPIVLTDFRLFGPPVMPESTRP